MKKFFGLLAGGALLLALGWFLRPALEGNGGTVSNPAPLPSLATAPESATNADVAQNDEPAPTSADAANALNQDALAKRVDALLAPRKVDWQMGVTPFEAPNLPPPDRHLSASAWTDLYARSPEEAQWLDRAGFPTQVELDRLEETDERQLAEQAAKGDTTSQALLGKKQYEAGNIGAGLRNLEEAAVMGSVWALRALAEIKIAKGDVQWAQALVIVAAMRGDREAGNLMHGIRDRKLTDRLHLSAFVRNLATATTIHQSILARRQALGLPPFDNLMRPMVTSGTSDSPMGLGVYARGRDQR